MILLCAMLTFASTGQGILPAERIRLSVAQYVAELMSRGSSEYVLEVRSIPQAKVSDPSGCTLRVVREASIAMKGFSAIPVEIICSGKVEQRVVVPVRIRTFGFVLVTNRQLGKHERVAPTDVSIEKIETTTLDDATLRDLKDITDKRTTRILPVRSILARHHLESIPAVKQDDIVMLTVRTRRSAVSTRGVAKEDGCIGAVITVQPEGKHDRVRARVVDKGLAELDVESVAVKR